MRNNILYNIKKNLKIKSWDSLFLYNFEFLIANY